MPFILMSGIPSSGKSTATRLLAEHFQAKGIDVKVISETDLMLRKGWSRDMLYGDSKLEKEIRGGLKTEYLRHIGPNNLVIIDGLNYIKGFRYELYCGSKTHKSTQCVIHCDPGIERAWEFNTSREINDQYNKIIFDGLVNRYEVPEDRNRWDSPLITLISTDNIPYNDISSLLFERKPPPPNQSTQCPPMSDTNFLHEVDKAIQLIVSSISTSIKMGIEGEIKVDGASEKVVLSAGTSMTLPNLLRLKRQFLVYVKSHPDLQLLTIPDLFVQYLNTNL